MTEQSRPFKVCSLVLEKKNLGLNTLSRLDILVEKNDITPDLLESEEYVYDIMHMMAHQESKADSNEFKSIEVIYKVVSENDLKNKEEPISFI